MRVGQYLRTGYHPDCEYVDGAVVDRNVGDRGHSELQRELILFFGKRAKAWGIHVFPGQRLRVSARRFRIPDVCLIWGPEPVEDVFSEPPLVCIEVLSKDDTLDRMQEKIDDFLEFGVRYVWVINPRNRRAWVHTTDGSREVKDGVLRTENPPLEVRLADLFDQS